MFALIKTLNYINDILSYYHCLPDHNHKQCYYEMVIIKASLKWKLQVPATIYIYPL